MNNTLIFLLVALFTHGAFQVFGGDPELTIKEEFCIQDYSDECEEEEEVVMDSFEKIVYNEIVAAGIEYPEVVLRQALLETGDFSSKVFKENCNLFGMKQARRRTTTAIGTNRHHAVYDDWRQSVVDYKHWQDYNFKSDSCEGDYYRYLISRKYATDKAYIRKLKNVELNIEQENV